jgi:hypothetical protein
VAAALGVGVDGPVYDESAPPHPTLQRSGSVDIKQSGVVSSGQDLAFYLPTPTPVADFLQSSGTKTSGAPSQPEKPTESEYREALQKLSFVRSRVHLRALEASQEYKTALSSVTMAMTDQIIEGVRPIDAMAMIKRSCDAALASLPEASPELTKLMTHSVVYTFKKAAEFASTDLTKLSHLDTTPDTRVLTGTVVESHPLWAKTQQMVKMASLALNASAISTQLAQQESDFRANLRSIGIDVPLEIA